MKRLPDISLPLCLLLILSLSSSCKNQKRANTVESENCPEFIAENWEHFYSPAFEGFMHAYQPCVVKVDDEEYPLRMWFFGWVADITNTDIAGADAIYLARGKDLNTWEVYCNDGGWDMGSETEKWASVLYSSDDPKDYYETFHTGDPSVVYKDGRYYMAYSATSQAFVDPDSDKPVLPPTFSNMEIEGYPAKMIQCVMGATSEDGIHWTKTEKPLLLGKSDTKYPPDPNPDRIGDFHRPSLLWDQKNEKWKLYCDYRNMSINKQSIVALAENTGDFRNDEFIFVHSLDKPIIENWPNPEVTDLGNCFVSFADPSGYSKATAPEGREISTWQKRQLKMAVSKDGLNWEKKYFFDPDPGIDANQVPQTLLLKEENGQWLYVFYTTQVGWRWEEGRYPFFEEGDYNWFYDQIRYMRYKIK